MTVTLWRSALVAALFALHPLHVESVAWVAERKDVLSTFFFMLTIWAYAKYAQSKVGARNKVQNLTSKVGGTGRTRLAYYALALVLFTLGLLSKPMVVTLPFVLLLLDYWPLRRWELETGESNRGNKLSRVITGRTLLLEKLPFLALSAGASLITFLVQDRAHSVSIGVPFEPRFANAIASYLKYLSKTVWPSNLAVFYPHPVLGSVTQDPWAPEVYAAGLVILGLTCWALYRLKREPWFAVGWFWYLGTLVPVIGIVQVGGQAMADRYTYIPLIGIFIVVVWAAAEFLNRAPVLVGLETGAPTGSLGWRRAWPGILGIAVVVACVAAAKGYKLQAFDCDPEAARLSVQFIPPKYK